MLWCNTEEPKAVGVLIWNGEKMIFNATELIAQAFDERNIKYEISETDESSILAVIFEVDTGLEEIVEFISTDDRNNVMVKISDLIQDVSPS